MDWENIQQVDQAAKTIELIKKKYPDPKVGGTGGEHHANYCVGGALARYASPLRSKLFAAVFGYKYFSDKYKYPGKMQLTEILQNLNSKLDYAKASEYAGKIIYANDDGDFDTAWKMAEFALAYPFEGGCLVDPSSAELKGENGRNTETSSGASV